MMDSGASDIPVTSMKNKKASSFQPRMMKSQVAGGKVGHNLYIAPPQPARGPTKVSS